MLNTNTNREERQREKPAITKDAKLWCYQASNFIYFEYNESFTVLNFHWLLSETSLSCGSSWRMAKKKLVAWQTNKQRTHAPAMNESNATDVLRLQKKKKIYIYNLSNWEHQNTSHEINSRTRSDHFRPPLGQEKFEFLSLFIEPRRDTD